MLASWDITTLNEKTTMWLWRKTIDRGLECSIHCEPVEQPLVLIPEVWTHDKPIDGPILIAPNLKDSSPTKKGLSGIIASFD